MPSTASSLLKVELQAAGENNNAWGTKANAVFSRLEEAIASRTAFTLGANKTLSDTDYVANESRSAFLDITGGAGGFSVTIPNRAKLYLVRNASSGAATITTGSGTTVSIAAGKVVWVVSTGSNVVYEEQPLNAQMKAIADLTSAANKLPYFTGAGTAALADFSSAGRALVDDADATAQVATLGLAKGFPVFCAGVPDGSEVVAGHIAPYAYTITQANCVLKSEVAATASTVFTLKKNGSSIGTSTFAISGTTASHSITGSPVSVAAGDKITLHAPSSPDTTLSTITGVYF